MKKSIAILVALLLSTVPASTLFTSCGNKTENQPANKDEQTEKKEESETDSATSPNVPKDLKFDGQTFSMLIGSSGGEMYAEEETGDIVNDIVYQRNARIEEQFGIKLNVVKSGFGATGSEQSLATQQFQSLIMAGDDTYHAFMHVQHTGMPQMILAGNFIDWNTIPYIDVSKPWWYQNITNDLCFGDKVYVMTGDYAMYIRSVDCLVFNKTIFDDLELEYPYKDVKNGTWTWDKFASLVAKGSKDLNGDGLMSFADDQYGLVGWTYELSPALLIGLGYQPLSKDADNMPVLNQNTDLATDIYGKIVDLFKDGKSAHAESSDYSGQLNMFTEGRAMFKDTFLSGITGFRDVEFDFGILPYPKYDEDADYHSRSSNMTGLTYIPVTNNNLDLTGAVLEELAYESYKELTPAYFDIVLTVKNTRDTESEEMLPIIRDSARFLYDGYAPSIISMVGNVTNSYSSTYASNLSKYLSDLDEMRELLKKEK